MLGQQFCNAGGRAIVPVILHDRNYGLRLNKYGAFYNHIHKAKRPRIGLEGDDLRHQHRSDGLLQVIDIHMNSPSLCRSFKKTGHFCTSHLHIETGKNVLSFESNQPISAFLLYEIEVERTEVVGNLT